MDNLWHNFIYPALQSPATTTLVAILAATGAFLIYFLRRRDSKRDSANIIVLEVKNAERNLAEARKTYEEARAKNIETIAFPEKLRLMNTESWTKYKYLFVRDFTPEQWDELSSFYENCKNFDEAVELKESSFKADVIEIRASINRIVGDYAKEIADKTELNPSQDPEIEKNNQKIVEEYTARKDIAVNANIKKLVERYGPDKHYNDAAYYYNLLPRSIINTPMGQRLLELSNKKLFPRWRRKK